MYLDRKYVRDIIKRVRFDEVREHKAQFIARKYGKQEATMFWDMLSTLIDEEYEHLIQEEDQLKEADNATVRSTD